MDEPPEHELLTEEELAAYLRVNLETVRRWRREGIGPPVMWAGRRRPRYRRADVDEWMRQGGA